MISSLLSNLVTSSAPLETDHPKFTCLRTVKQRSKTLNNSKLVFYLLDWGEKGKLEDMKYSI